MERVALAEAIEVELSKRNGVRHDTSSAVENFPQLKAGKTRDIAAQKVGLGSGKTLEAALNLRAQG